MKLLIFFLLISSVCFGQSTYIISADSTKMRKVGGSNELILENATRNITGVLVNKGNGRTEFSKPVRSGDTLFIGRDTILGVSPAWSLTGNTGLDSTINFIGTTDIKPLRFRVNNTKSGSINFLGTTYFGYQAGATDTTGQTWNTAIGGGAMQNYVPAGSHGNVSIGFQSLNNYAGISGSGANTVSGYQAGLNYAGFGSQSGANVFMGYRAGYGAPSSGAYRNIYIGINSGYSVGGGQIVQGNVGIGAFTHEWGTFGQFNVATGYAALRHNTDGNYNTAYGYNSLNGNTSQIRSIEISAGGTGYTSPVVVISAPNTAPSGSPTSGTQATATATQSGGVINSITITNKGARYSAGATATITDPTGTGAALTVTLESGNNNVSVGFASLQGNVTGNNNTAIGFLSGLGAGGDESSMYDSSVVFIGDSASRSSSIPSTTPIKRSVAIGPNSKISQDNTIILGRVDALRPNIGIGTITPSYPLDITGRMRVTDTARFTGVSLTTNVADNVPVVNGIMDATQTKIMYRGSSEGGLGLYRAQAGNFGGATISTYRTNSNDLNVKTAMMSAQSFFQIQSYGVNGGGTVSTGSLIRTRANGTPKTTYIPSYFEIQLRDTVGGFGTSFLTSPEATKVGTNLTTITPSAQLEVESNVRGFLPPRMTTTQQNAIASPATGLIVFNTDTASLFQYTGSAWENIHSSGAATGGYFDPAQTASVNTTHDGNVKEFRVLNLSANEFRAGVLNYSSSSIDSTTAQMVSTLNNGDESYFVNTDVTNRRILIRAYDTSPLLESDIELKPDSIYFYQENGIYHFDNVPTDNTVTFVYGKDASNRLSKRTVSSLFTGSATNDAASSGQIGEEINSTVSTYTNYSTTATYQNVTSITLTAGDWDLSAFFTYSSNSATITAAANSIFVISTTTASASGATEGQNISYVPQAALLGSSKFSDAIAPYRVSLSGTTTFYLNTQATFTLGNPQYVGGLRGRRMR